MTRLIHQPHDKFFKQAMADIRVARDFFEEHLPAEILAQLDLSTLKLEKQSFIDESYKATEADVLYSVTLVAGERAYLYLLCEHQTNIDDLIGFRLLVSRVRIIETHLKQHRKKSLPVVYSMVIYTGEKAWNAPLDFYELFGAQSELARQILLQPYQLIDVQRLGDDELRQHRWSGLVAFVLKYRKVRDFANFLETMLPWLQELASQEGSLFARAVLSYIVDGIQEKDAKLFIEKSQQYLTTTLQEEAMTLAQVFREEGHEQGLKLGLQQGLQQGIEQGIEQGMEKIISSMLCRGLTAAEIAKLTGLSLSEIEALQPLNQF